MLKRAGIEYTAYLTQNRGHAVWLTRQFAFDHKMLILCVGGDGTLNEIVNGLMTVETNAANRPALAVMPAGTGSDFARSLGLTGPLDRIVKDLLAGQLRTIDVGRIDFRQENRSWTRYFINVFDAGLGGQVVRLANTLPKSMGGFLTFFLSSIAGLLAFRPPRLSIAIDQQPAVTGMISIVGCANGQYFGGGMHIAPMARLDDGRMEILYVWDTNLFKFMRRVLLPVYQAGHLGYERLGHRPGRTVTINAPRSFLCEVDGEEERAASAAVTLVPGSLRVLIPAAA